MGCYSWKYCDCPNERMICGMVKDSYLLIPLPFGGGHVLERCYNGYGRMGIYDIYELAAEWNRTWIMESFFPKPEREDYGDDEDGRKYYESAIKAYEWKCRRLHDYNSRNGRSDAYMTAKYGTDWKREIGIDIACCDEDNARLKFPIKIAAYSSSVYEDCGPSARDPLQGCY